MMGNATYEFVEMRFDVREQDKTHCYVYIQTTGDAPHMMSGWHHKAYPATHSTLDIHRGIAEGDNPIYWERLAPPEVVTGEGGQLAKAVLAWPAIEITDPRWAFWEALRSLAESVIGERKHFEAPPQTN